MLTRIDKYWKRVRLDFALTNETEQAFSQVPLPERLPGLSYSERLLLPLPCRYSRRHAAPYIVLDISIN
jgi:hypothetical protein